MKKVLLAILLVVPAALRAQQLDDFGGLVAEACPAPNHRVNFTGSQSGTTQTVAITGATITADPNVSTDYDVSVSGITFIIGVNEPFIIGGTSTAMDWSFVASATDYKNGVSLLASVTTGSPGSLTLTAHASNTVASASGWIEPGRFYDPFSQGTQIGVTPLSPQFTVKDVNGNSTIPICTPEGHRIFLQALSSAATGAPGSGAYDSQTISSISASGGVVTISGLSQSAMSFFEVGNLITVTGVSPSSFNVTNVPITSWTLATGAITYADASASGSGSGGTLAFAGFVGNGVKYASASQAVSAMTAKFQAIGFNAYGEDSDTCFQPSGCPGTSLLPVLHAGLTTASPTLYSSQDLWGFIPQPVMIFTTTDLNIGSLTATAVNHELDWFDPNFAVYFRSAFGPTAINPLNPYYESPESLGLMADDSDVQQITNGGTLFRGGNQSTTFNGGGQFDHVGYLLAEASPHQGADELTLYGNPPGPNLYPSNVLNSKKLSTSAPGHCWWYLSQTTPGGNPIGPSYAACTWPDWVRNWYGTVAAMNTAWGSNYTTFGSSETQVTGASVGTGNGSTTTFTATLHTNVTENSIQVFLTPSGGSAQFIAADCPNNLQACATGTAGAGVMIYNTASSNVTFKAFPATTYVQTGFLFIDSNNNVEQITSARGQTGSSFTAPGTCTGTQTTVTGSVTATCIGPGLTSASTITYSTGALSLTFASAVPTGEAITVTYAWGGWPGGTGLADESGSGTWLGTNTACMLNPPNWAAGQAYTAYQPVPLTDPASGAWIEPTATGTSGSTDPNLAKTPGVTGSDGTVSYFSIGGPVCAASGGVLPVTINANQNWAADATNWAAQLQYAYANALQTVTHQIVPDTINFGVNFGIQSYDVPQYAPMLAAESANTDAAFTGSFPIPASLDAAGPYKLKYLTTYFNKPIVSEWFFVTTNQGPYPWGGTCNTPETSLCAPDLVSRSQLVYNAISTELNASGANGVNPMAGFTVFPQMDANLGTAAYGFEDRLDNFFDGTEDSTRQETCNWGLGAYSCGLENGAANYLGVDAIRCYHCIRPAFRLWLGVDCKDTMGACMQAASGTSSKFQ